LPRYVARFSLNQPATASGFSLTYCSATAGLSFAQPATKPGGRLRNQASTSGPTGLPRVSRVGVGGGGAGPGCRGPPRRAAGAAQQGVGRPPVAGAGSRGVIPVPGGGRPRLEVFLSLEVLADQQRPARPGGVRHGVAVFIGQAAVGLVGEQALAVAPEDQGVKD